MSLEVLFLPRSLAQALLSESPGPISDVTLAFYTTLFLSHGGSLLGFALGCGEHGVFVLAGIILDKSSPSQPLNVTFCRYLALGPPADGGKSAHHRKAENRVRRVSFREHYELQGTWKETSALGTFFRRCLVEFGANPCLFPTSLRRL